MVGKMRFEGRTGPPVPDDGEWAVNCFYFPPDSMQDAKKSIIAMTKKLDNNKNFPFIRSSPQEIWKMNGFMHSVYFSKFHLNK